MIAAPLDAIRDLIQRDIGNRGLARDPNDNLFTACRDDFANACRSLAENPQGILAIVTGFPIVGTDPCCGETDGPLGAVFLARALQPMGMRLVLVTDDFCRTALEIGLRACGLGECVPVVTLPKRRKRAAYKSFPWNPYPMLTHLIALERAGPGGSGRCRNMRGRDITEEMAPAHLLFDWDLQGLLLPITIGIGDGGNEIGMGKIPLDTIRRNIPNGDVIACGVPVHHLIVAGVSNWGAYGLAAGVALLRGQRLPSELFDIERERELLQLMVEQGPLVDGVTAQQTVTVDGLAFENYAEPLRQLGELLGNEDG